MDPVRLMPAAALAALALLAACGHRTPKPVTAVTPAGISHAEIDALWARAMREYGNGHWGKAATLLERVTLEVPAGDTLAIAARFRLAECYFGQKSQLQAAREFRKVADDTPDAALAPEALLRAGDSYADLWRRPELDPTYGQTALATYQELLNRYPDAPASARARLRVTELEELFARKELKSAEYYFKLKAYDSAILYLKDIAATYPRAEVTPTALLQLVESYRKVGYAEDLQETCGYIRRYHPATPGLQESCPAPRDTVPPAAPKDSVAAPAPTGR
jgi:outer membrane protein assembly factor BamD